jgi:outer membrane biosynthesis protein TonB
VLSDTQGVDLGPYLTKVVDAVRRNWYTFIPEEARAPEMKGGKLTIEFVILPDGKVTAMRVAAPSGDVQPGSRSLGWHHRVHPIRAVA